MDAFLGKNINKTVSKKIFSCRFIAMKKIEDNFR